MCLCFLSTYNSYFEKDPRCSVICVQIITGRQHSYFKVNMCVIKTRLSMHEIYACGCEERGCGHIYAYMLESFQ